MTITRRAAKTKGSQFQKEIAKQIQDTFKLEESDVVSNPNSYSGMDIILSNKAKEVFNFAVEAKRQESTQIWEWLKQTEKNAGDLTPLLIFRRNRSDTYCCLKFDDFLSLLSNGETHELSTMHQTND